MAEDTRTATEAAAVEDGGAESQPWWGGQETAVVETPGDGSADDDKNLQAFNDAFGGKVPSDTPDTPDLTTDPAELASPKQETEPAETADEGPIEAPEGFDQALQAAIDAGIPKDQIKNWFETDQEGFIKYGQESHASPGGQDAAQAQTQEARQVTDDTGRALPPPPEQFMAVVNQQLTEALKPIVEGEDSELFGSVAAPIQSAINSVAGHLAGYVAAVSQHAQQQFDAIEGRRVDDRINQLRKDRMGDYPQLKSDTTQAKVLQKYDQLASLGQHADVDTAYDEALKWAMSGENGTTAFSEAREHLLGKARNRRAGRPSSRSMQPQPTPPGAEAKSNALFNKLYSKHMGALPDR